MKTKIKICGLKRPEDIAYANAVQPDLIGFVFAPSKRQVSATEAGALKRGLCSGIKAVGVFVNAPLTEIGSLAGAGVIDVIQLHGDENQEYMSRLKECCPLIPVVKCVRIGAKEDFQNINLLPCDYLLLDTYRKNQYGGSGIQFDWSLIPPLDRPYYLAGGLTLETMERACQLRPVPYCLDMSSTAETDGVKDYNKMKLLVENMRRINQWQTEDLEVTADSSYLRR